MGKKLTQEEVVIKVFEMCKLKKYTLIEPFNYTTANKTRLKLKCNIDGHEWNPSYSSFVIMNIGCPKCGGSLKITQKDAELKVQEKCKLKNITLVESFVYINSNETKLKLKCNIDGHEWIPSYSSFIIHDKGCTICGNKRNSERLLLSQEDANKNVNNRCKETNYKLMKPFNYNGNETELYLRCDIHNHEWIVRYVNFVNNKTGCKFCGFEKTANLKRYSQEEANECVIKKCNDINCVFEPFIYDGYNTKLYLTCNKYGHSWISLFSAFIMGDSGCPYCKESKGENKIEKYLNNLNIEHIRQMKFDDCKGIRNRLPFDFYIPCLNTCIEFDGSQHFESKSHWGGESGFNDIKRSDSIKNEYCEKNDIRLIRIKYTEDVEKILKESLNIY